MKIVGDIHIDKRFPYTNKKTLGRWRQLQLDTLRNEIFTSLEPFMQVGDLFDNFMVSAEQFVLADCEVASKCINVLAGNHDTSNNTEKASAVHLLMNAVSRSTCHAVGGYNYILIPHQLTQEQFEAELDLVFTMCTNQIPNILLLHCNYGDREGTQTENYLRPERARQLLTEGIAGIIFGHEHNGGERMDQVIAAGSILPMNFGEMTDKFIWDVENWKAVKIWDSEKHYSKWAFGEFLTRGPHEPKQFIEVTGEVTPAESLLVKKHIANWYTESETLIAIKDSTTPLKVDSTDDREHVNQLNWDSTILAQLTEEEQTLFLEMKNEIENPNAE